MNVIDSLSKGFQTVNRYWWLILLPILLDTFLWIGPHASAEQIMQRALNTLETEMADVSTPETSELLETLQTIVEEAVPQYNGFSSLRVGMLSVPSLLSWRGMRLGSPSIYEIMWILFALITNRPDLLLSVSDATFVEVSVWEFPHVWAWLLVSAVLSVIGVFIGCAYLVSVSHSLSEEGALESFGRRVLNLAGRFTLFWILRTGVLLMLGIPFFLVIAVLNALSPALASLFGSIALGLLTWLSFYGIFFIAALAMNDASVWRAIWNSFNVVIRNFGATFGLFLLINLIGGGLTILWQRLSTGAPWTWIAIAGNAYVGTGLVAASLAFYQDRYARWREAIANVLAGGGGKVGADR